jgi:hypothetical protein
VLAAGLFLLRRRFLRLTRLLEVDCEAFSPTHLGESTT